MFKWFIISLLIFCSSNFCYSQTILKFVDQHSNKPPSDFLFYLIQDSITFINCGIPNSEGILKFRKIEENKNHTYQIKFNQLKYEHIFKNIAINNSDTTIIYLKHNNYFIEEDSNYYSNRPSEISLLPYIPRTIRSFNDLPSDILEKVKNYLNNRFSNNFSKNFELTIGLIIDVDYLKRKNPEYNNNTYYYLNFSYRNLNAGISMFNSTLKLDKNGNVLKDLDFPIIKSDSLKIYSFNNAKLLALKHGALKKSKTEIQLGFNPKKNILIWKFINEETINDHQILRTEFIINGKNGRPMGTNKIYIEYVI